MSDTHHRSQAVCGIIQWPMISGAAIIILSLCTGVTCSRCTEGITPPIFIKVRNGSATLPCNLNNLDRDIDSVEKQYWAIDYSENELHVVDRWPKDDNYTIYDPTFEGIAQVTDRFDLVLNGISESLYGCYRCVVSVSTAAEIVLTRVFLNGTGEEQPDPHSNPPDVTKDPPHALSCRDIAVATVIPLLLIVLLSVSFYLYKRRPCSERCWKCSPCVENPETPDSVIDGGEVNGSKSEGSSPPIPEVHRSLPLLTVRPEIDEPPYIIEPEELDRKRKDLHDLAGYMLKNIPEKPERERRKIVDNMSKFLREQRSCKWGTWRQDEIRDPQTISAKTLTECQECGNIMQESSEGAFVVFVATFFERLKCVSNPQANHFRTAILGSITPTPQDEGNPFRFPAEPKMEGDTREDEKSFLFADVLHRALCHRFCLLIMALLHENKSSSLEKSINGMIYKFTKSLKEMGNNQGPSVTTDDIFEGIEVPDEEIGFSAKCIAESVAQTGIDRLSREELMIAVLQHVYDKMTGQSAEDKE